MGVKPPESFAERSLGCPLGHAGDEGPHLRDDGGVSGWFSSGGPRVRVLTRYDGDTWTWGDPSSANRVTGSARGFCLVVTRRRHIADTDLVTEGEAAREWMEIA